jgi:hypothetical protein
MSGIIWPWRQAASHRTLRIRESGRSNAGATASSSAPQRMPPWLLKLRRDASDRLAGPGQARSRLITVAKRPWRITVVHLPHGMTRLKPCRERGRGRGGGRGGGGGRGIYIRSTCHGCCRAGSKSSPHPQTHTPTTTHLHTPCAISSPLLRILYTYRSSSATTSPSCFNCCDRHAKPLCWMLGGVGAIARGRSSIPRPIPQSHPSSSSASIGLPHGLP